MKLSSPIAWFLTAASVCACLDLSPLRYVDPSTQKDAAVNVPDANDADASAVDAAADPLVDECRMCLATGPCSAESDACNADSKCAAFGACMSDTVCWGTSLADISMVASCITDCGNHAGLLSQVDPAIGLLLPLLLCAQGPGCASSCAPLLVK
jgi:hypothetical protein